MFLDIGMMVTEYSIKIATLKDLEKDVEKVDKIGKNEAYKNILHSFKTVQKRILLLHFLKLFYFYQINKRCLKN